MSPPRRVPRRALESLHPSDIFRVIGGRKPTDCIEYYLCLRVRLDPRLDVLHDHAVKLRINVPLSRRHAAAQLCVRRQVILVVEVLPVRADLGLAHEVGRPSRVEVGGEAVPVAGNV